MNIAGQSVKVFKIKNRKGHAAICCGHLTEGKTPQQALERMAKAVARTGRKRR